MINSFASSISSGCLDEPKINPKYVGSFAMVLIGKAFRRAANVPTNMMTNAAGFARADKLEPFKTIPPIKVARPTIIPNTVETFIIILQKFHY